MIDAAQNQAGASRSLGFLLEALNLHADKAAVLAYQAQGVRQMSCRQLHDLACGLAAGLRKQGIRQHERVIILAHNSPEWLVACLAVIAAGAVAVPVDVQLEDTVLAHLLADSQAVCVFTESEQVERLRRLSPGSDLSVFLLDGHEDGRRHWRQHLVEEWRPLPSLAGDDTALLFYTSGTTRLPKGVPLSHANIAFELQAIAALGLLGPGDRVLVPLPLHHIYPFVAGMLLPLLLGAPVVFPSSLTGPQLMRALKEAQVTAIVGVPRLYRALYSGIVSQAEARGCLAGWVVKAAIALCAWLRRLRLRPGKVLLWPLHRRIGPRLRLLACGGAALDPDLAWKLEGIGWGVAIGYGLTETSPLLTAKPPGDLRFSSVGRAIPGVEIRIDPAAIPAEEGVESAAAGEARMEGEIQARGPNVFGGYHHLPEETGQAFAGQGWFKTGDLGFIDHSGRLTITGRLSSMIVTESGKNIQPDTVEAAYASCPEIREIGVLQKDRRLVAVIVPDADVLGTGQDVRRALRLAVREQSGRLPSYKRLADYVASGEPLPRTRLGKLQRHLLKERYDQLKAGQTPNSGGPVRLEAMSDQDRALLGNALARQVWDLLVRRYPGRRLSPDTSPQLELDVDSLEWLNLTLAIRQETGAELREEAIGRVASVRDLLQEATKAGCSGKVSGGIDFLDNPEAVLDQASRKWLRPLGRSWSWLAWLVFMPVRLAMAGMFRLQVAGLENLPGRGAFVLTPNHVSYLDPFALAAALGYRRLRHMYWGGWTGAAFSTPLRRGLSRLAQVMPIDPDQAVMSSLAFGASVLKRGQGLIWFPEGGRSPDGQLKPFKPGIGILLEHFDVPVVPVVIRGTFEALPLHRHVPRPHRVTVTFGEPLSPTALEVEGEGPDAPTRIATALQQRVAKMISRLRSR